MPIPEILERFSELSRSTTYMDAEGGEQVLRFLLGNHGAVAVPLLWVGLMFLHVNNTGPALKGLRPMNRMIDAALSTYHLLFAAMTIPTALVGGAIVQFIGLALLGSAGGVLIGAFAFSMVLPRMMTWLLAVAFLLAALADTDFDSHALDMNTAPIEDVIALPAVGPPLARRIINHRPYDEVDQLQRVPGIGPGKLEQLKRLVQV